MGSNLLYLYDPMTNRFRWQHPYGGVFFDTPVPTHPIRKQDDSQNPVKKEIKVAEFEGGALKKENIGEVISDSINQKMKYINRFDNLLSKKKSGVKGSGLMML